MASALQRRWERDEGTGRGHVCGNAEKRSAESKESTGGCCCVDLTHAQPGGELPAESEFGSSDAGAETCVGASGEGADLSGGNGGQAHAARLHCGPSSPA